MKQGSERRAQQIEPDVARVRTSFLLDDDFSPPAYPVARDAVDRETGTIFANAIIIAFNRICNWTKADIDIDRLHRLSNGQLGELQIAPNVQVEQPIMKARGHRIMVNAG